MSRAGFALRVALLPVAVLAGVWLHGQSASVAMTLMPVPDTGPLSIAVKISQGFLAATLNAALACYPLARLYGRVASGVATLIVLSVLAGALQAGSGAITDAALLLQVWSMACFAALLFGGIWLARRRAGDSAR